MIRSRAILSGSGAAAALPFTGASLDMNFTNGSYVGATLANMTVARANPVATDLTYDQTTRTSYTLFGAGVLRIDASGSAKGLLVEESRTQYLGATDAPATQTTSSLGTGTYTCWCIGGTSVAVAGTTATITGAGSATPGTPLTFTVTVAGTVTATVTGAVKYFQIENGAFATSYIPNQAAAGTTVVRSADAVSIGGGTFTTFYGSPTAVTMFIQGLSGAGTDTSTNQYFGSINDNSGNNRLSLFRAFTTRFLTSRIVSGGSAANPGNGVSALTDLTVHKVALGAAVGASQGIACHNGTLVGASSPAALPVSPTQFTIGSGETAATAPFNGFIQRVAYFRSRLTDVQLQALTS